MPNFITIDGAKIDADLFATMTTQAMSELKEEHEAKEKAKEFAQNFKESVESAAQRTGLDKKELSNYWKDRFKETLPKDDDKSVGTKVVIDRGNLYQLLNSTIDD